MKMSGSTAMFLAAGVLIVGIDLYWAVKVDLPRNIEEAIRITFNDWKEINLTPRRPYPEFKNLVESKEAASLLKRVDLVDSNYAGVYFVVKPKGAVDSYRVYVPNDAKDGLFNKLAAKGIPVESLYCCH
ncbi:MAG: hypothetical protein BWY75_02309 [bacterium ADurb.Bin425]|nr:MAG: hypothetical protein BWY75_02309 [bacterium ADurb.Bin425]